MYTLNCSHNYINLISIYLQQYIIFFSVNVMFFFLSGSYYLRWVSPFSSFIYFSVLFDWFKWNTYLIPWTVCGRWGNKYLSSTSLLPFYDVYPHCMTSLYAEWAHWYSVYSQLLESRHKKYSILKGPIIVFMFSYHSHPLYVTCLLFPLFICRFKWIKQQYTIIYIFLLF